MRYLLLKLGAHRTFDALDCVLRARTGLQRRSRRAYVKFRAGALKVHYRVQRCRRLDPKLAVFAAYWERGYSCNPAAIEAAVRELAPDVRTAWITTPKYAHTLPPGVQRLHPGSLAYWTALARATYLVNNVNFSRLYVKRPGQTNIHTHHGTPLKHMGLDLQEYPAAARTMNFGRLLDHIDRWDYSLSANRHSTLIWERAYPGAFTTLEYGYPRNDLFQRAGTDDVLRVRAQLGIADGITAVLYAPTHRDYQRDFVPHVDLERMARELGPGHVILLRAHYLYSDKATLPGSVMDVSDHPSVEELCLASDVLVTDYSSIMFDYANLDRPIIVHTEDWTAYRAARGVYFDLPAEPPGLVARTQDELIDILTTGAWRGPRSTELRAAFRVRFCAHDDGYAAERVVRHLFLGQHSGLPATVPLESRRPAPAPARARLLMAPHSDTPAARTVSGS
jgi:CDP-glycerol glycerophosphotransferase (TagB/SpsB family)